MSNKLTFWQLFIKTIKSIPDMILFILNDLQYRIDYTNAYYENIEWDRKKAIENHWRYTYHENGGCTITGGCSTINIELKNTTLTNNNNNGNIEV